MATRPATGGALRPSTLLGPLLSIALALAIGSVPVAALFTLNAQMEALP